MTPEWVHTLFAETLELFELVSGQPTYTYRQHIREAFALILISIPYNENGGTDNLLVLIMADTKYNAVYEQYFICPKYLAAYNASFTIDAKTAKPVRAEDNHNACIEKHNI